MKRTFGSICILFASFFSAQQKQDTIKSNDIDEVKIVARKPTVESKVDRTVFNVSNSSILAGNTTWDILKMTPLVTIDQNDEIRSEGESVTVYINDRKTVFKGKELKEYLRTISADNLMKIEVITSPSSRYETSGQVINIVLKKRDDEGWKGSMSFNNRQSSHNNQYANVNLNYHKGKFTQTLGGGFQRGLSSISSYSENYFYSDQSLHQIATEQIGESKTPSLSSASEWEINSKNSLGFILEGYLNEYSSQSLADVLYSKNQITNDHFTRLHDNGNKYRALGSNFFYKYYDKEKNRIFDVNLGFNYSDNKTNHQFLQDNLFTQNQEIIRGSKSFFERNYYLKLDYTQPLDNEDASSLEIGGKVEINNRFIPTDIDVNTTNNVGLLTKGRFRYKDQLSSIYANITRTFFEVLETRVGLRYEYIDYQFTQDANSDHRKKGYGVLMPSLLLKYNVTDNFNITGNYNGNVWRPWYSEFDSFLIPDETAGMYSMGNPDLIQNPNHRVGLKFGLYKKYFLSASYWFSDQDYWGTYIRQGQNIISMPENFKGRVERYTFSFNTNQTFFNNKFNVNLNLGMSYLDNSDFNRQNGLDAKSYMSNFNASTNLTYTNLFNQNINLSGWVSVQTQNHGNSMGNIPNYFHTISVTKLLPEYQLEATLGLNNIFYKPKNDITTYTPLGTFTNKVTWDWYGVSLTIVKRFGNQKVKENSKTSAEKTDGGSK